MRVLFSARNLLNFFCRCINFVYWSNKVNLYIIFAKVGSCDNDEDGSNQDAEADNGDFPRTNSFRMRDGNIGMASQNGKRRYGNIAEACNGKNHVDEIREACSGTGQILDAGDIFGTEVTNAKFSRSSHDPKKRGKKVLFGRGILL